MGKPVRSEFPEGAKGLHEWAQALRQWYRDTGTPLPDLTRIFNNARRNDG